MTRRRSCDQPIDFRAVGGERLAATGRSEATK